MRNSNHKAVKAVKAISALLGVIDGNFQVKNDPDRSARDANRMKLDRSELATLETLSGKEKKDYVKLLREKHKND